MQPSRRPRIGRDAAYIDIEISCLTCAVPASVWAGSPLPSFCTSHISTLKSSVLREFAFGCLTAPDCKASSVQTAFWQARCPVGSALCTVATDHARQLEWADFCPPCALQLLQQLTSQLQVSKSFRVHRYLYPGCGGSPNELETSGPAKALCSCRQPAAVQIAGRSPTLPSP